MHKNKTFNNNNMMHTYLIPVKYKNGLYEYLSTVLFFNNK